jgi:hypothetical protein
MSHATFGRINFVTSDYAKTVAWLHDNLTMIVDEYHWAHDGDKISYGWFRPKDVLGDQQFLAANPEATILPSILDHAALDAAHLALLAPAGIVIGDTPYVAYKKLQKHLIAQGYHHRHLNPDLY